MSQWQLGAVRVWVIREHHVRMGVVSVLRGGLEVGHQAQVRIGALCEVVKNVKLQYRKIRRSHILWLCLCLYRIPICRAYEWVKKKGTSRDSIPESNHLSNGFEDVYQLVLAHVIRDIAHCHRGFKYRVLSELRGTYQIRLCSSRLSVFSMST